eukprot:531585_1
MKITHLSILLLSIYSITFGDFQPSFSASDIDRLRISVLNKIDSFGNIDDPSSMKPLLGSIVRLVFHDCAGPLNTGLTQDDIDNNIRICDGCIDFDLADHAGLKGFAVQPIEEICMEFSSLINRADCWSAIGTIALEYASSLSSKTGSLPILPYYIGRNECKFSPNAITTSETTFPSPHLGWDPLFDFFKDFYDFDLDETTVLMGAHSLGRAHKSASGFDGKWTHNSWEFNNQFFVELLDKSNQWDQTKIESNGFQQWSNKGRLPTENELIMMNVDISLVANVEELDANGESYIDEESGIISCRWEGFKLRPKEIICPREKSFGISLKYALDNQLFLNDFAAVWNKLITHNYDDDNELTKIIPYAFRDKRNDPPTKNPSKKPTQSPILIRRTENDGFCCIAKRIPNWNGRCWGNLNENDCFNEGPGNGKRCYWDSNNCRNEQKCLLRMELCNNNSECCSKRCRKKKKKKGIEQD